MFCTKCGKEYKDGQLFCTGCGEKIGGGTAQQEQPIQQEQPAQQVLQQTPKPKNRLPLIIGGIAAVVVFVVCGVAAFFLLGGSADKSAESETESEETEIVSEETEVETETEEETQKAEEDSYTADESEWKAAYYEFLTTNSDIQELLAEEGDYASFYLIYVDDNDVPELYMDSYFGYTGDMMATYYGKVGYMTGIGPYGNCCYVEKSGQFENFDGRMGYYTETIFAVDQGEIYITDSGEMMEGGQYEDGEWYYEYTWNGEDVNEEDYDAARNAVYAYDESIACSSSSTALTYDELLDYLGGGEASGDEEQTSFESTYLDWQESYSYDLDSDGTPEEIYCEIYTDFEDYYGCEVLVYVNGENVIDSYGEYSIGGSVMLCDFDSQDPYREIYVELHSDSDCFDKAAAYRYQNGRVMEYYSVDSADVTASRWSLKLEQAGDGTVCYEEEYFGVSLGMGNAYHTFTVENQTLVSVPTDVYEVTDTWKESDYYALYSLTLLSEVDGTETGEVVDEGECFHVQQLYSPFGDGMLYDYWNGDSYERRITYIYVVTDSGKSGWIKLPDEEFYETQPGSGYYYAWG